MRHALLRMAQERVAQRLRQDRWLMRHAHEKCSCGMRTAACTAGITAEMIGLAIHKQQPNAAIGLQLPVQLLNGDVKPFRGL